jgi:hypothetical protein
MQARGRSLAGEYEGTCADDNDAPIFPGAISKPSARELCYRRGGDDAAPTTVDYADGISTHN